MTLSALKRHGEIIYNDSKHLGQLSYLSLYFEQSMPIHFCIHTINKTISVFVFLLATFDHYEWEILLPYVERTSYLLRVYSYFNILNLFYRLSQDVSETITFREHAYQCQPSIILIIVLVSVQLNRWVLSWDLKDSSDWLFLVSGGSRFRASGADTSSKIRRSWDDDEVAACGRSQSASGTDVSHRLVGRSLLDTLVQDHVKPCRLANKACIVCLSVVEPAASEVDHTAHDWCDQTRAFFGVQFYTKVQF